MNNRKKNIIYCILLACSALLVWWYPKNQVPEPIKIDGKTMGTTYHITYFDEQKRNFKASVDSLFLLVNKSINTYDSTSEVSRFNMSETGVAIRFPYLYPPLKTAQEVFASSSGAFDPTVMPLVNAWGFGPGKQLPLDSNAIDSIKTFIGFKNVRITADSVTKTDPRIQLDFGGIGQGYGADVVTDFLKSKGIVNMLVELGGEGMACGKNLKNDKAWEIGILDPQSTYEHQFFKAYVALTDRSFTTSGNYFNYREINGVTYSHTIDPQTGYPAKRALLSASVFANDCTTADAWDTAFMVMGHEKAIQLLKANPTIDAFLIFTNNAGNMETYQTPGIKNLIRIESNQAQL